MAAVQRLGGQDPLAVHLEVLGLGALVSVQPAHRVQHRVVLDRRDQDAAAAVPAGPVQALDGQVVGLGATAGEDHLAGAGVQDLSDLLAGLLHHTAGAAARVVQRRRVAELGQFLGHHLDGFGQHRRCRRMIEVNHEVSLAGRGGHTATARTPAGRGGPPS